MREKRHAKRMDLEVKLTLRSIGEKTTENKSYDVEVINISKGGMAFKCEKDLQIGGFYDIRVIIWTKEKVDAVIRIVRKDEDIYGAEFVGLNPNDQFRIEVYELFNYSDEASNKK